MASRLASFITSKIHLMHRTNLIKAQNKKKHVRILGFADPPHQKQMSSNERQGVK